MIKKQNSCFFCVFFNSTINRQNFQNRSASIYNSKGGILFMIKSENKFYTCKYDKPFKEIMLKKSNEDILKALLKSILNVEIKDIEINSPEATVGNLNVKAKNFDCLLTTEKGKIEIELNAESVDYVHPRNMGYICNVYATHTLVGEEYDEDTDIIQINLTYNLKKMNMIIRICEYIR